MGLIGSTVTLHRRLFRPRQAAPDAYALSSRIARVIAVTLVTAGIGISCNSDGPAAPTDDSRVVDKNGIWHLALPEKPVSETEPPDIWLMPDELVERTDVNVRIFGEVQKFVNFSIPTGGAARWNKVYPLDPLPSGDYTVEVLAADDDDILLRGKFEVGP